MEDNNDKSKSSSFKLLQPELMTIGELCEILRACCVKNDLSSYNKNELVELFKRVALPLPQREYSGNNWREKLLANNQKRKASETLERTKVKRICATNGSSKNETTSSPTINTRKKVLPLGHTTYTSRLEPPVNLNNYTKKVLKLALPDSGSSNNPASKNQKLCSKSQGSSSESKKIVLENKNNEETSEKFHKPATAGKQSKTNGKHKRIVIDFSDASTTTTKTPKIVNLKRSLDEKATVGSGMVGEAVESLAGGTEAMEGGS